MKLRLGLILLTSAAFFSVTGYASAQTDDSTRVENGVTIKSGTPAKTIPSLAPEKKASERMESFPTPVSDINKSPPPDISAAPAASPEDDFEDLEDINIEPKTKKSSKITMKPIVDKKDKGRKSESKPIESNPSPFKKSQDAGATETISKPQPKPEVSGKSLMDEDNITDDLKNLDTIKKNKDRATNADDGVGESGLPIPRFVTLKSGEANARTGPGDSYPIRWVYQRKNLPVQVTAEFKLWRRIKDFDGEQSWVHQALLSSRRYCIVQHDATAQSDYEDGHNVARFKRGVQIRLVSCKKDACKIEYGNIEGWLKKKDLWGVDKVEVFD